MLATIRKEDNNMTPTATQSTTTKRRNATKPDPTVTRIMETEPNSNIFKCSVPSTTWSNVVYTVTVRATWYPYTAQCQCPGSTGNCKHKHAAIKAVDAYRTNRWHHRKPTGPLEWSLGNESPLNGGAA